MNDKFSIAEARSQLPRLLREVETGHAVEITRRGKPVAVVVSAAEFERLREARPGLWDAISAFRIDHDVARKGLDRKDLSALRDRSPGRDVRW